MESAEVPVCQFVPPFNFSSVETEIIDAEISKFSVQVLLYIFKHFKLESIENALDLITKCCSFGSVDLKDAYYNIPILENYQKYLKLFWKEEHYQYIVLPNGFSPAIRVFTKGLTPPFKYLRSKGYLSVEYINDSLLLGETFRTFRILELQLHSYRN